MCTSIEGTHPSGHPPSLPGPGAVHGRYAGYARLLRLESAAHAAAFLAKGPAEYAAELRGLEDTAWEIRRRSGAILVSLEPRQTKETHKR